jgi:FkbM family methyltransferase
MLRQISLYCAGRPAFRRLAHFAFRIPGVGYGLREAMDSIVPHDQRVWTQIPSGIAKGLWLNVLPKWEPGYLRGVAEEGMNEALARYLKPGSCFYDVGAHIGFYSLIAARLVGKAGRVMAFEPDPDNAQVVQENAAKNDFAQISMFCAAVSDQPGSVRFQRSPCDGASRMSGMLIGDNSPAAQKSEVLSCSAVSLDSFCSSHPAPDLIKIDVEGAEIQVLEGARSLLRQKKPVLIIEVHDERDHPAAQSILSGLGYTLQPLCIRPGATRARNFVAEVSA